MKKEITREKSELTLTLHKIPARSLRNFGVKNTIELLENSGLIEVSKAVEDLEKWPLEKIETLVVDLYDYLDQERPTASSGIESISPFTTFAGASMRGEAGCREPACRTAKLKILKNFAAMYADYVYCPIPLFHPSIGEPRHAIRQGLITSVITLLELRPLIESGRVRPIPPVMHYCEDCAAVALREHKEGMKTVRSQVAKHLKEFSFSCVQPSKEFPFTAVFIKGPSDFIEHGSLVSLYKEIPDWLPRSHKIGESRLLRSNSAAHANLVEGIFRRIASDVLFRRHSAIFSNAAYLTDLAGEVRFLQLLSDKDELAIRTAAVCSQLSHEIPLLTDIPLRTVLKIREDNPESFEAYRTTLRKIVQEYIQQNRTTTKQEAREVYRDCLLPALAELRSEAKRQHSLWKKKSLGTAGLALGVVALGATGILQPQQILPLLGGAVVKSLVDQLSEANNEPVTSNNLYFLLRLEQEQTKRLRC